MKIKFPCRSINDSDEPIDALNMAIDNIRVVEIK